MVQTCASAFSVFGALDSLQVVLACPKAAEAQRSLLKLLVPPMLQHERIESRTMWVQPELVMQKPLGHYLQLCLMQEMRVVNVRQQVRVVNGQLVVKEQLLVPVVTGKRLLRVQLVNGQLVVRLVKEQLLQVRVVTGQLGKRLLRVQLVNGQLVGRLVKEQLLVPVVTGQLGKRLLRVQLVNG